MSSDETTMGPEEGFKMKNVPAPDEAFKMKQAPDEEDTEAHRFHGTAIPDEAGPNEAKRYGIPEED